ncbi:MAG: GNAT family N-acetyltransferase [Proteobacteria bacterium]|nr:GNAT family N-acetyltransferase [Pseudomonadota bacterium]MBU1742240.1 GNAT family N-acetyltransferase [Pseudomonadota bacterium]
MPPKVISFNDSYVPDIVRLDAAWRAEMGDAFSHQDWTEDHFRLDLPGKQKLSRLALDENGRLVGFWSASIRRRTAHTHRVAVDPSWRRSGLGRLMFESFREAALSAGCEDMTISLTFANDAARRFYEALGYRLMFGVDLEKFVAATGRPGRVEHDRVLEEGRAYVIMRRSLGREEP